MVSTVPSEVKDDLQFEQESRENRQYTATSNTNTAQLLHFSKIIAGYWESYGTRKYIEQKAEY